MAIIKTNDPDFCKDDYSGAVINTNVNAYRQYKLQRNNQGEVSSLNKKIETLESELRELKTLLKDIVREKHGNSHI
jgi:galactokinase/mevalonate kinase-like predicted kinase